MYEQGTISPWDAGARRQKELKRWLLLGTVLEGLMSLRTMLTGYGRAPSLHDIPECGLDTLQNPIDVFIAMN